MKVERVETTADDCLVFSATSGHLTHWYVVRFAAGDRVTVLSSSGLHLNDVWLKQIADHDIGGFDYLALHTALAEFPREQGLLAQGYRDNFTNIEPSPF